MKEQKEKEAARKGVETEELEPEAIVDPSTVDTLEDEKKPVVNQGTVAPTSNPVQSSTTASISSASTSSQPTVSTSNTASVSVAPTPTTTVQSAQTVATSTPVFTPTTAPVTQTATSVPSAVTQPQPVPVTQPVATTGVAGTSTQIPIVSFDGTNASSPSGNES